MVEEKIKEGYKKTEIGIIPDDWKIDNLGAHSYITKLAGFEYSKHFNSYKDGGEIIVIRGTNITNNKLDLKDIKTIPIMTSRKLPRSQLNKGDLVFAYVGTIGPVYLITEDLKYHLGPNTSKITANNNLDVKYLYIYFNSWLIKSEINEFVSVGAQPSLSMRKIRNFKIIIPEIQEQQKIAEVMYDVDNLLQSLEKLIEKKKKVKQGTMQQLLTGKKRLPGFSGEWVVKKLGDIVSFYKGKGLSKAKLDNDGKNKCLLYGELFTTYNDVINDVVSYTNYFEGTPSIIGDILIPVSTTTTGIDLAIASTINIDDVLIGGDVNILRPFIRLNSEFLSRYLTNIRKNEIFQETQGITIIHLYGKNLFNIEIDLPKYDEQCAISKVITNMDSEIESLQQKLEKYKKIKQGMMQELLTGRIRLI